MTEEWPAEIRTALEHATWIPATVHTLPNPPEAYQLTDGTHVLAWIEQRNRYCDRGHWQAIVECVPSLDAYDGFPRYYMRLEVAKQEVLDFLRWRLCKVRAEDTPPTVLDEMLETRAEATVCTPEEHAKSLAYCTRKDRPYMSVSHDFEFDESRGVHVCACGASVPDREPA